MSSPMVGLIWAESEGGIIGSDGTLPWHLPEDLAHFKQLTLGSPVIMGRTSWDALPPRFRPLPGRRNIVVTRNVQWQADGAEVEHSVDEALALAAEEPGVSTVWVIGGAQVFNSAVDRADRLELTQIRERFDGDTTAPAIDQSWAETSADPQSGWHTSGTGLQYRFLSYTRRQPPPCHRMSPTKEPVAECGVSAPPLRGVCSASVIGDSGAWQGRSSTAAFRAADAQI